MTPQRPASDPGLALLCAADDAYALPLAVTLFSALTALERRGAVRLYLVDGGIGEPKRRRLERVLAGVPVELEVRWVRLGAVTDLLRGLPEPPPGYISVAANYRLLAPYLVPEPRVLYLDSDVVVRRDLRGVFEADLAGCAVAAVVDASFPTLGDSIENWRDQDLDPDRPYFNSGVLLIDLERWRADGTAEALLANLQEHAATYKYQDQDVLNAVLQGRWLALDGRWNVQLGSPRESVAPAEAAVLHFTSEYKPWRWAAFGRLRGPYAHFHRLLRRSGWFTEREYLSFALRYHLNVAGTLPARLSRRWPRRARLRR